MDNTAFERVINVMSSQTTTPSEALTQYLRTRMESEPLADAACSILIHACGVAISNELRAKLLAAAQ